MIIPPFVFVLNTNAHIRDSNGIFGLLSFLLKKFRAEFKAYSFYYIAF